MRKTIRSPALLLALPALLLGLGAVVAFAENVDPWSDDSQYAWGEDVGWLNAEPGGDGAWGVHVTDTAVTGYMWGENIGWISLHCANTANCHGPAGMWGVINADGSGALAGYAWGENVGWINMSCLNNPPSCSPTPWGVYVDPANGTFYGHAWGENIGWISFSDTGPVPYQVQTGWACAAAAIDNGPGIAADDVTVPNSPGLAGCSHDGDLDNDGLPDSEDTNPLGAIGICSAYSGSDDGHPSPAGGDISNDDDHDGNPAPPMGTDNDGSDNGPSWDTDNDGVPDGAECLSAYNPRDPLSKPSAGECGGFADTDGDGLRDAWEKCKWGTNPAVINSDGDALGDCKEAADVDGNGAVTFTGDVIMYAKAAQLPTASFGKTMDFDIDGNASITFTGDVITEAKFAQIPGLCQ